MVEPAVEEPKPFASLSSGLLARKGQARPAMRPQPYDAAGASLDDLGWNDMGESRAERTPPPPLGLSPVGAAHLPPEPDGHAVHEAEVRETGDVLAATVVSLAHGEARGKAAFTLRLDAVRHLRLRLACALDRRSAQQIVTDALDAYLETMPNLDMVAGTIPAATRRNGMKRGVGR